MNLRRQILGRRGPKRAELRPERADFRPERANSRPEKADSRPERADFRPERVDFSPDRADISPERVLGDDQMNEQTEVKMKVPCVLQDFIPFRATA